MNQLLNRVVKIKFTYEEMWADQDQWQREVGGNPDDYTHRDFVRKRFANKGYKVIKPIELRYFYNKKFVVVEGSVGIAVESM